jgi:hypothetical protein
LLPNSRMIVLDGMPMDTRAEASNARGDFEDRPTAVGPTTGRCPVEAPVGGLDECRSELAVRAPALGAEAV